MTEKLKPCPFCGGEAKRKAHATCPKCGARMFKNTQNGRWDCPKCFESYDKGAVA